MSLPVLTLLETGIYSFKVNNELRMQRSCVMDHEIYLINVRKSQ